MKKAIHIIVLPVLAAAVALLSACTTTRPDETSMESKARIDELSQRLSKLEKQLDQVASGNQKTKDDTGKYYRKLTFHFSNLQAAGKEKAKIRSELDKILKREYDFEVVSTDPLIYTKRDAWGVTNDEQIKIADRVNESAELWKGRLQGDRNFDMPVVRSERPSDLKFYEVTHRYNVTSGAAVSVVSPATCELAFVIHLDPESIHGEEPYAYNPRTKELIPFQHGILSIKGPAVKHDPRLFKREGICQPEIQNIGRLIGKPVPIMVVKRGDPDAAQYYEARYCWPGKIRKCPEQLRYILPAKLTVGKPACPPAAWDKDAREKMKKRLGACL